MAEALALVSKGAEGTAAEAPTPGLSEEQRAMLKAAYNDIDTNKSGTIEVSEFKSVAGLKLVSFCALSLLELPISEVDVSFFCVWGKQGDAEDESTAYRWADWGRFQTSWAKSDHFPVGEGDKENTKVTCDVLEVLTWMRTKSWATTSMRSLWSKAGSGCDFDSPPKASLKHAFF